MTDGSTRSVLSEIFVERSRQDDKWGEQNHPDIDYLLLTEDATPLEIARWYGIPTANAAKSACDSLNSTGRLTWADILIEEVAEAVEAAGSSKSELRAELLQVAAVAVAWAEAIDRR